MGSDAVHARSSDAARARSFSTRTSGASGVHYVSRGVIDMDGRTKLIRNISYGMDQLYDLSTDPMELNNVADAKPALRDKLAEMVDSWEAYENKDGKSFETVNKEKKKD